MPLNQGFPAVSGVVDAAQLRSNLAGLVARNTAGVPRAGVFPRHSNNLISGTAGLAYAVAPFEGVVLIDGDPVFISLRGGESVSTDAPPASNSRIDIVCVRQGATDPELFVVKGTAAANPNRPTVPADAIELGSAQMTSGATNTNALTFTNTARYTTTSGGTLPVLNAADLEAWTPMDSNRAYRLDIGINYQRVNGAWTDRPGVRRWGPAAFVREAGWTLAENTFIEVERGIARGYIHATRSTPIPANGSAPAITFPEGARPLAVVSPPVGGSTGGASAGVAVVNTEGLTTIFTRNANSQFGFSFIWPVA